MMPWTDGAACRVRAVNAAIGGVLYQDRINSRTRDAKMTKDSYDRTNQGITSTIDCTRKGSNGATDAVCHATSCVELHCVVWSGFTGELLAERQFGQVGDRVGRGAGGSQAAIPLSRGAHSGKHRVPLYNRINRISSTNSRSLLLCRDILLGTRSCCYFVLPACLPVLPPVLYRPTECKVVPKCLLTGWSMHGLCCTLCSTLCSSGIESQSG